MKPLSWALILAGLLTACGPYRGPARPAGVPAAAVWVGDRKAGVFVEQGPKDGPWFRLKIYDDRTGVLKAEGVYVLEGMGRVVIYDHELKGWDGRAVILEDGTRLVPRP